MTGQVVAAQEASGLGEPVGTTNTTANINAAKAIGYTSEAGEAVKIKEASIASSNTTQHTSQGGETVKVQNTVVIGLTNTTHYNSEDGVTIAVRSNVSIGGATILSNAAEATPKPTIVSNAYDGASELGDAVLKPGSVTIVTLQTPDGATFKVEVAKGMKIVRIPDLFASFKSITPIVHPHYAEARAETEASMIKVLGSDEKLAKRIHMTNWSYFACASAPLATKEDVKLLCDWGNWVFPFDDQFDNGDLKDDPIKGKKMVDDCMAALRGNTPETFGLAVAHNTIWQKVVEMAAASTIPNKQNRYAVSMEDYVAGALGHVKDFAVGKIPSIEDFVKIRSASGGVRPTIALCELLHKIELPDNVYEHPCLEVFRRVTVDVVLIDNDILSYQKEESEGVPHNIITVLRHSGMTTQEAFDEAGEMLRKCYREWYLAQADLPLWGEKIDGEVQKYIDVCRNIMLASLNWHFVSDRYFPGMKEAIRHCRVVVIKDQ